MAVKNVASPAPQVMTQSGPAKNGEITGANQARQAALSGYGQAKGASQANRAAEVNISSRAKEMATANRIARETPDVREDKVQMFKDMIARGEYRPDAGKIADGIVREAIRDELALTPEVALES